MIRKRPGFAALCIAVLALGAGANSAVFSKVYATLLRPLAVPDLERLVAIRNSDTRRPALGRPVTPADFSTGGSALHPSSRSPVTSYITSSSARRARRRKAFMAFVTPELFSTLGIRPALGREFIGSDRDDVVILNDRLWRERFLGDPRIVGRHFLLDSRTLTVVGVTAPGFEFPFTSVSLWAPFVFEEADKSERKDEKLFAIARLRDGVSLREAKAEMAVQAKRLEREYPESNEDRGAEVVLLREWQAQFSGPFLVLLQSTAILVLLVACANLANLQLAQSLLRRSEIAVRASLGAGRWRVARLLLIESLILPIAGGAPGSDRGIRH